MFFFKGSKHSIGPTSKILINNPCNFSRNLYSLALFSVFVLCLFMLISTKSFAGFFGKSPVLKISTAAVNGIQPLSSSNYVLASCNHGGYVKLSGYGQGTIWKNTLCAPLTLITVSNGKRSKPYTMNIKKYPYNYCHFTPHDHGRGTFIMNFIVTDAKGDFIVKCNTAH